MAVDLFTVQDQKSVIITGPAASIEDKRSCYMGQVSLEVDSKKGVAIYYNK